MSAFYREKPVKPKKKKGLEFAWLMGCTALLVVPILVITSKQSSLINVGYSITELRERNTQLREEQARLRTEIARFRRPNETFRKALALGLKPVQPENKFTVAYRSPEPADSGEPVMVALLDGTED